MRITKQAMEKFRTHYPNATRGDVMVAWESGTELATQVLRVVTGRIQAADDTYVATPEGRGILVRDSEGVVRTYLRLSPAQQRALLGKVSPKDKTDQIWTEQLVAPVGVRLKDIEVRDTALEELLTPECARAWLLASTRTWDVEKNWCSCVDRVGLEMVLLPNRRASSYALCSVMEAEAEVRARGVRIFRVQESEAPSDEEMEAAYWAEQEAHYRNLLNLPTPSAAVPQ